MAERVVACPFCGSAQTTMVAPFGGSLLTSQHRCVTCNTYFEAVRERPPRPRRRSTPPRK